MSDTATASPVTEHASPTFETPVSDDRSAQRGRAEHPLWARLAMVAIVVSALGTYAWNVAGMQLHLYYGPGVKSMSQSWTAWLSGAYDPQLATTFDKLPGTFWLQALSARVFGYSSWAVLLPTLAASIGAVILLYLIVNRWTGPVAAVVAAGCYASTPLVAALARTQIPDPVLVLLLLVAALIWQQAVRTARTGLLLWTGVWIGLAFQVKMAQAWLVWVPFGIAYLLFAPAGWGRRIAQLVAAGGLTLAVSLTWVGVMAVLPPSARPYIDGSVDNSIWSMVFGYNGFNRYGVDNPGAEVLGIGGPAGRSEGPAWMYLLREGVAPQVGWLYPMALAGLVAAGLILARHRRPLDVPAVHAMWVLWLLVHAAAFASSVKAHTFYNLALTPALAALAGAGVHHLWRAYRGPGWRRWLLPTVVVATAAWSWHLAGRFPTFAGWPPVTAAIAGTIAAVALVVVPMVARTRPAARTVAFVAALAAVAVAPVTWTLSVTDNTGVSDAHRPAAGPSSRETSTVLSGRMLRMLPSAEIDRITAHLAANSGDEQYQIAVQWAPQAGQFLLREVPVLPVGGFTAQVPTITAPELAELTATNRLRFALVDGPATKGRPTPDYPGYADWVRASCRPVPELDQPLYTLYDCRR